MHTIFPKVAPFGLTLAAVALLAIVALPFFLPGTAQAAKGATVSIEKQAYSVDEDDFVTVTIKLNKKLKRDVSFTVATVDGTATSAYDDEQDYIGLTPTKLTIHAGYKEIYLLMGAISDNVEDDSETYTVTLQVDEGESLKVGRGEATVTIREPAPAPVENLTLTANGTTVGATWDAAAHGAEATKWITRIQATDNKSDGILKKRGAKKTNVTFHNLEPGKSYDVWVRGVNKFGHKGPRAQATITMPE